MYHRVDTPACDPWELAVSPANFEQQLRVIRDHWTPVSLAQLADGVAAGKVPDRAVALTFDDGYIDNFEQARPLLEQYGIPATFFIATQNTERQSLFWWDELQDLILETETLPAEIGLPIGGEALRFTLADETTLTPSLRARQQVWSAADPPPTRRCQLYYDLWRRLRPLSDAEQQQALTALRRLIAPPAGPAKPVCMPPGQLRHLLGNPLFSIGAHTVTHTALADQDAETQLREIGQSKVFLEKLTGGPVPLFAYPYGSHTDTTVAIVQNTPFRAAVTTEPGVVTRASHPLRLNRYPVNNWKGHEFKARLARWFQN